MNNRLITISILIVLIVVVWAGPDVYKARAIFKMTQKAISVCGNGEVGSVSLIEFSCRVPANK